MVTQLPKEEEVEIEAGIEEYEYNNEYDEEEEDDSNSKKKRGRLHGTRRMVVSPVRSLALAFKTKMTQQSNNVEVYKKWIRILLLMVILFALLIALVGIITALLPPPTLKATFHPELEEKSKYQCVGWHTTVGFYPFAIPRLWRYINHAVFRRISLPCNIKVQPDETGYCELRHKKTGQPLLMLPQSYDGPFHGSKPPAPVFACDRAYQVFEFQKLIKIKSGKSGNGSGKHALPSSSSSSSSSSQQPLQFTTDQADQAEGINDGNRRGILIYLQQYELVSVYVIVQLLRTEYNCQLPIELWIHGGEDRLGIKGDTPSILEDPIWLALLQNDNNNISYRIHWDHHYQGVSNIPYALAYTTQFDDVLVLSTTSFPTRDPTFLFDSPLYLAKGALFWKDLFSPQVKESTIKQELILGIFDLLPASTSVSTDSDDNDNKKKNNQHRLLLQQEMEMDSGQMVINLHKTKHALQLLLFMSSDPWWSMLDSFRAMKNNKDLFRLAWYFTQTPFQYVQPAPAILSSSSTKAYCTQTIIQHSPPTKTKTKTKTTITDSNSNDDGPDPLFVNFRGGDFYDFITTTTNGVGDSASGASGAAAGAAAWDHGEYFKTTKAGDNRGDDDDDGQKQQYSLGTYWATADQVQPCYYIKKFSLWRHFQQRSFESITQLEDNVRKYAKEAMEITKNEKRRKKKNNNNKQ